MSAQESDARRAATTIDMPHCMADTQREKKYHGAYALSAAMFRWAT